MKAWLFNPFKFIAGYKALVSGLALMLLTALICMFTNTHLDGVIDVHRGAVSRGWLYFAEPVIDWICLVLPLYIFGRIFSVSEIRLVDVAGTGALARYPMICVVLLQLIFPLSINDPQKLINALQHDPRFMAQIIIVGLFTIPFLVLTVALMYNGYALSANLKGPKAVWSFIASMLIAEILSKLLIYVII